ncbi:hypothetical protein ACFYO1_39250 [Nocardia sp. NPDC006044]|uniref:hypothetical protein n=1 Tax=Nocardia sp. NPDC006044 TaxID=3364306 RepID=UPI0036890AED
MTASTNRVVHPPLLAVVLGAGGVAVMATAVLLTHDRTPAPAPAPAPAVVSVPAAVSSRTSARPDGCVMFCDDKPLSSFRDANCADGPPLIGFTLWTCEHVTVPAPEGKR